MGFVRKIFLGGVFSIVLFNFIFGSSYEVGKSSENGFVSNILKQISFTQKPTAVDQAFGQLNAALLDIYEEAGIAIEPTNDIQIDANQAMAVSMQQITDILNEELNAYNNK